MEKRRIVSVLGLLCMPLAISLGILAPPDLPGCQTEGKRSERFVYSGYTSAEFKSHAKQSLFVPVRDGTKLAVDVFLPSEGPNNGPFPVAFCYTSYGRAAVDLKTGKLFDAAGTPSGQLLLSHGYALVAADMRGTGASFGTQVLMSPVLGEDGKELVDWIAGQKWSNGSVGMFGQSYLGWSQLATAKNRPRALKCIIPEVIFFEAYTEAVRPGGIEAVHWIKNYSLYLQGHELNIFSPESGLYPAAPVVDEDGDGDLADEIPLAEKGDPTSFLDDGFPPRYRDGAARSGNFYFLATREHASDPTTEAVTAGMPFIDSRFAGQAGDFSFVLASPGAWIPEIVQSGIPIYHLGGWFDGFCKGTLKLYATMQGKTTEKLLIAPRFHMPRVTPPYQELFDYGDDLGKQLDVERLRFFDRYLKGIPNGIESEPPISLYVMNSGWRSEREWPLARQVVSKFYFDDRGQLSPKRGAEGSDDYSVDFTQNSLYGSNASDRWFMMAPPDELMVRTEKDKQCLYYQTAPLSRDLEVTGHPVMDLWLTSNQKNGDIFVYLGDVDENRRSLHVTEGGLRAGWKDLYPDDDQVDAAIDVRPDLPWHGYKKSQWSERALDPSRPTNLRFDLYPTSWLFRKGHRVRVSIAGADFPNFELNPGLSPSGKPEDCPATRLRIFRTRDFSSSIELPIIPKK